MFLGFAPTRYFADRTPHARASEGDARRVLDLQDALGAICNGRWDEAEAKLLAHCDCGDARILNLLGAVFQKKQEWKKARRFYGKAIKADRKYGPAQQNMRHLYELHAFGHSDRAIMLIDCEQEFLATPRIDSALMRQ